MSRIFTLTFLVLGLFACGGPDEYVLTGTSRSAGTDGMMIVEETGGNFMITVELEHLPPPSRLSQQGKFYVVWIKPSSGVPQMAGRLDYNEDTRVGRMSATSPHGNFEMIITVETSLNAASPSEIVVAKKRTSQGGG